MAMERADSGCRGERHDMAETSLVTPIFTAPEISLPKFSSNQLTWEEFWYLFCLLIHDVPDLPGVQKLYNNT